MKTDFLPSGNHFFSTFSDSSQLLPVKGVFSSTGTYFSVNPSFRLVKMSFLSTGNINFLFQVFSSNQKYYLNLGEAINFLHTETVFFSQSQVLLEIISVVMRQWQFFSSRGNVYFNETFHSGKWKRIFRLVETVFWFCSEVFPPGGNRY